MSPLSILISLNENPLLSKPELFQHLHPKQKPVFGSPNPQALFRSIPQEYHTSPYIFVYNCQRERIIVPFRRTDDQAILRMWIKSASDTVYLCSFQKNGYASGHVLRCGPCFPQLSVAANLSYPAGFSDKRRPQFLRSASPQMGAVAAPIRGHASRYNSNAANRLRFPDSVFFLLFSIFTDGRLPE